MMQPPPETVCKLSQALPTCPDSDSEAHNLSSFTYIKNLSRVIESYSQGKSFTLIEKSVPWKLCFQASAWTLNSLYDKHIISLLKVCLKVSLFYADFCKARKSLLWHTQCLLGSARRRGTQTLPKSVLGPGYAPTHPSSPQKGNPEPGDWGCRGQGHRPMIHFRPSLSADEAALNMEFLLKCCQY